MAYTYGTTTNATVVGHGTRSEYQVRLGWQLNSQNIANNTSNISLRLEVRSINSSYYTHGYTQTSTIGSKTFDAVTFDMRSTNTWQIFATRTYDVTHNDDGTYSAERTGSFTTNATADWSLKSGSASVSYTLPTIPRYATVTTNVSNITQSSVDVAWSSDVAVDQVQYRLNGSTWVNAETNINKTKGSYTISGLTPATYYKIEFDYKRKDSQKWSYSAGYSGSREITTLDYVIHTKINGEWKKAVPYVNVNGEWKKAVPYVNVNAEWKQCKD